MKKSRVLVVFLVLALAVSLSGNVFADDTTVDQPGETKIEVKSTLMLPEIAVTIATPTDVIVNPYGMTVTIDGVDSNDTLFSTPNLITNDSDIKMKITATPTASVTDPSTVKIVTSDSALKDAEKAVFMTLSMANADAIDISEYNAEDKNGTGGKTTFTNTKPAVLTDKNANNHNSCFIILDDNTSGETYGVYLITGKSGGTGKWLQGTDVVDLQLVFDIQPTA